MIGRARGCTITLLLLSFALFAASFPADARAAASKLAETLTQVQLFEGLTPEELTLLEGVATLRVGGAGERIVEQGKSLGRMLIIMDGEADVIVSGQKVVTLSGQVLIGEIEFLDQQPATADVVLLEKADLVEIDNSALNDLMEKHPRLGYVIIRRIAVIEAQRLRSSTQ